MTTSSTARLTGRELRVALLASRDLDNYTIARRLEEADVTVITSLLTNAAAKIGARSRSELTRALGLALFGAELGQTELEVAVRVLAGASNRQIGVALGYNERTISAYAGAALMKAGVRARAGLAARAETRGRMPLPPGGVDAVARVGCLADDDLEVLELLAEGMEAADIATKLKKTLPGIRNRASKLHGKLGVRSTIEAVRLYWAWRTGQTST